MAFLIKIKKKQEQFFQYGFSILEIMIAMTIFSVFILSYMASQSSRLDQSIRTKKEVSLHRLCEEKLSTILLKPPKLEPMLLNVPNTGTLEEHEDFEYKVEWMRFQLPDQLLDFFITKVDTNKDLDKKNDGPREPNLVEKKVFENIKKNAVEYIWQVRVTITRKENEHFYQLSSWVENPEAVIHLSI